MRTSECWVTASSSPVAEKSPTCLSTHWSAVLGIGGGRRIEAVPSILSAKAGFPLLPHGYLPQTQHSLKPKEQNVIILNIMGKETLRTESNNDGGRGITMENYLRG